MADDLKRVGLVFKEDGSADFVKSLKLVNAELRENYQNFKLTQTQWNNSTTTTQKLKDQLTYLNNAYDLQKNKVTTLKEQLNALENAENRDEVAITRKKAALTQAETSLQKYKNQIDDVKNKLKLSSEAIKEFGEQVQDKGKKIEEAGKKFSAFSVATIGAFTASAKEAIEFESAFTGVEKTVDATDTQLEELKVQIRDMAKEIPSSTTEISAVAEAAGQLGIKTKDIMSFTRVMIDLGNSTNLSANEAATSLAKFANVTKMSADDYSRLGSTIVALGNNFATTEADIVDMGTKLAATGKLTGLSQAQIMALATAMSSVGIEAEAGGTAMSKLLKQIQVAVETGSEDLQSFANVAGMSAEDFKKAFEKDAVKALSKFIGGLNDTERNGKSAIGILDDMGIKEVRLSNTILSLANSSDLMNDAVELANKSWKENNALSNEANKRYETLQSKMKVALNKIKDIGITIGNKLMPSIEKVINQIGKWADSFSKLDEKQVDTIVNLGLIVAAMAPVISTVGKMVTGIGQVVSSYGKFQQALGTMITKADASGSAMTGLLKVIQGMTSPIGLACTAIGVAIAGIVIASNKTNEKVKKDFETIGNSAFEFINGIDNAKSHLDSFNSELFASAQEQQELKSNMDQIQKGITQICKTASDERREYTQQEITQLDEYFTKLRELKDREIQLQSEIATAITQQAVTNAANFQGSLEEYKVQAQEWINTATQQKEATIKLIEEGTIEEVALLNQRYATEEERQSEAYQNEYSKIMEQKQAKIEAANREVGEVCQVYESGYLERSRQNDGFYSLLEQYNKMLEDENNRHTQKIQDIENGNFNWILGKTKDTRAEYEKHSDNLKNIWQDMSENMSDEQRKQFAVWLAQVAQTEMYGGEISDETRGMVNRIMDSYDSMPPKMRESMRNAMAPLLTEMENKEPSLFAKAYNIANGILNRLKKAFDIHSPSKKTRQIMQYVMQPMEDEMEEGRKHLISQAGELAEGVNEKLENINGQVNVSGKVRKNISPGITNLQDTIDYERLFNIFLRALNSCKIQLDKEGFIKFIDNRLLEVM